MKITVLPAARNDLLRQIEYYRDEIDAAHVAEQLLRGFAEAIEQLRRMPKMGAPKDLANPRLRGLRVWPIAGISDIRIYYIAGPSIIQVIRVLHGKQDIGAILEDRE